MKGFSFRSVWAKVLVATLTLCLPVFFASIFGPLFGLTVLIAAATAPYWLSWKQVNLDNRFLLMATGVAFAGFTFDTLYFRSMRRR